MGDELVELGVVGEVDDDDEGGVLDRTELGVLDLEGVVDDVELLLPSGLD